MRRIAPRLALLGLAAACVAAAPPETAPPETAPPQAAPHIDVEQYALPNGLTVLLSRDDRLPVVAVEVRYLVGSAHEPEGRSGFAHLFEHLMFQGSGHYDDEYFKPFEPIGGVINGTTNADRTNFFERVPSPYLELAMWMESDRMESLLDALDQGKLDNQRDVVKNERRQRYENTPYGMFWKYLTELLHPEGHPYHHTTIGSHADLTAASLDDVKAFFRQYYVPANAVVTVVGDFDPAATKALITKYFGHMPAGERAPTPQATRPVPTEPRHLTYTDTVKLPRIYLAWPSPALYEEGDSALDVLATVLSDGKTSRLYLPLVYQQKLVKDVSAFQVSQGLSGFFVVQATVAPGHTVDEVAPALEAALATALATPPTADEMSRALNGWKKSFYQRIEGVVSRAQLLSNYFHQAGRADYLAADLARYVELTPEKVQAATRFLEAPARRIDILPGEKPAEKEGDQ